MIHKPTHATMNPKRKTSTLFFNEGIEPMEVYLRGGICWPIPIAEEQNDVSGFVVLLGQDVHTGMIWVFEETQFVSIEPFVKDNEILAPGVGEFFMRCWSQYYATTYYVNQPDTLNMRYARRIYRSDMINPYPKFIHTHWDTRAEAETTLWEQLSMDTLQREDLDLQDNIRRFDPNLTNTPPSIHALLCALNGMDKTPWREPKDDDPGPEIRHVFASGPIIK